MPTELDKAMINKIIHQSLSVGPSVCPIIWTTSYQGIANLSTGLDSLGQGVGYKTIWRVIGPEIKIFLFLWTLFQ